VEQYGDLNYLLRRKLFLRGDIQSKQLGSPLPVMSLLRNLKPSWFAVHLHTRFEARVQHEPPGPSTVTASNPDVIGDEDDNFDIPSTTARQNQAEIVLENEIETFLPPPLAPRETKFLALVP
jgi:lariat debranching enzyme